MFIIPYNFLFQFTVFMFIRRLYIHTTNALKPNNNIIHPEQLTIPENIISISPGGFMGVYMFGICTYIKDHYKLEPYVFSGASAGAWNALMMTYQPPPHTLLHDIHRQIFESKELDSIRDIRQIEYWLKKKIIHSYDTKRFELSKLYIGTTTLHRNMNTKTTIFHDFQTLEEAIDCCIASSHIPFVTGGVLHRFRSHITFDGGFSRNPYLTNKEHCHILHIKSNMWDNTTKYNKNYNPFFDTTIFSRDAFNFKEMYEKGYSDARHHKHRLDKILNHK